MKILNELTIKNLKLNKKRTIVTIIGIILSTSLMVGIGLLFSTFQDYMIEEVTSYSGSYHALYSGLSADSLKNINGESEFTTFYEKGIGFSKIDTDNEYKPYLYIMEVNKNYFNELKLIEGRFPENDNELVISSHISSNGSKDYAVGESITLDYGYRVFEGEKNYNNDGYIEGENLVITDSREYTIVGIVSRSNYEDYSASGYSVFTLNENLDGNINLYTVFNQKNKIINQAKELAKELNYDENAIIYNASLLALYGESGYSNVSSSMVKMLVIMLSLVSIGCIIVIYNSFAISVMERKKEFGLLSSIGSTRKQLSYMVFFEALIVGLIGIILGIVGAYIGIGVVVAIINNLIGDLLEYKLHLVTNMMFIIIPVIFMALVILISAIVPSRRASKVSPIEAIRQNDDIKINRKKIKTSKFINKLFGIEGEIALKNIKRNKKKYRITIVSLFISIVLFISFSAYMNYTLNTVNNVVGEYPYDITIVYYDESDTIKQKIDQIVNSPEVDDYVKYKVVEVPIKRINNYTEEYKNYAKNRFMDDYDELFAKNKFDYISVIVLDDNSYDTYKEKIGLNEDKIILLNNYKGVTYSNDARVNYDIPVVKKGNLNLTICNFAEVNDDEIKENSDNYCNKNINNIFITDKSYYLAPELASYDSYKLVVNEKIFKAIIDNNEMVTHIVNIVSDNYVNIDKMGEELSKQENVYYSNIEEDSKMERNLVLSIEILMYGFIALITLIGVTSVFNTISTSMALRKKEFAILRSIGLTKKGFNKILFFESLFFGLKSLLYALPMSFIIIVLIHMSLSGVVSSGGIMVPWNNVILAIIMVFMIVLLTMLYSSNKIKKHNILEQIREENI